MDTGEGDLLTNSSDFSIRISPVISPERRPRDVVVAREALEIDLGQDVAEGVIRQTEEQIVLRRASCA